MKNTKEEVVEIVGKYLEGVESFGIRFYVDPMLIWETDGYWRVDVRPTVEPKRLMSAFEEMSFVEERLRDDGYDDIVVYLGEAAPVPVAVAV
jgi:hypothetical protein